MIIGIPVLFAFAVRGIFGVQGWAAIFTVMSVAFIFLLPVGVGALTIGLSNIENVRRKSYCIFKPWLPITCFFILTMFLNAEGRACWVMILPIFLAASSIGGMIAGHYKLKKRNEKMYVSILALLPFFVSPLEQMIGSGMRAAYLLFFTEELG